MLTQNTVTELSQSPLLPRIHASNAQALNRLYGHGQSIDFKFPGRTYYLHWVFEMPPRVAQDTYAFRLGHHVGMLGLDTVSVCALLNERQADVLPHDLRHILLADTLFPLVEMLEKKLRMRFEWMPTQTKPPGHAGELEQAAFFKATPGTGNDPTVQGFLSFQDARALDAVVPALAYVQIANPRGLMHLRFPVSFLIGTTRVRLHEVGSIVAGDIIGIDQWTASGSAIVVTASLGGAAGRQLVGLAEGTRIKLQQVKDVEMNRDIPPPSSAPSEAQPSTSLPIDRLDALEVSLRFEVGDLTLSLGELKSIRAGHTFDLAQPLNRSPVRILAHGNVLGKGYLVAIGDRLGVRVSEFTPNEA
jgi:type III secretion protein Q